MTNPYEDMTPEPWMASGVCATTGEPDDWFADEVGALSRTLDSTTQNAIRACQTCPVQQTCLEYALNNNLRFGVWGGVTANGRRRLREANAA